MNEYVFPVVVLASLALCRGSPDDVSIVLATQSVRILSQLDFALSWCGRHARRRRLKNKYIS
jgi:hypothetical protein